MIDPPTELLRRHGLSARKSWGQHFLHDPHVRGEIVAASGVGGGSRVVEIGAGLGTLTAALLDSGAQVWAIERDRDLCQVLRLEFGDRQGLRLIEADAVEFDYGTASAGLARPVTVVGNLPYHLTGRLLFALLDHHQATGRWVVMVQREVADRLCATVGGRVYGGITVLLSRVRAIDMVCRVGRGSFVPPPRVDSAVVSFDPLPHARGEVDDENGLRVLVRTAFQRRRKTLANALAPLATRDRVVGWCEAAGVDVTLRPERLEPEAFAAVQRARERDDA